MRSIGLVIFTSLILLGAFFLYAHIETGRQKTPIDGPVSVVVPPPPAPRTHGTGSAFEQGEGAWLNSYDEKGELKDRFRGAQYAPQDSGVVLVQKPVAEFFMGGAGSAARLNHQMMRMTGTTGEVVMPQSAGGASGSGFSATSGTPKRGRIHNCRVDLFNLFPDSQSDVPDEQIWINNVQFDNETMLITSESFTDNDHDVPADQVPVKLRGKKYDFDGRGLRLRWNDKDGRLELLEVAHGEQLVVKDASAVSGMMGPATGKIQKTRPAPSAAPTALKLEPPLLEALATDRSSAIFALEPSTPNPAPSRAKEKPPAPPIPYLATFYDNVCITQADEIKVTADKMEVDFTTRRDSSTPTSRPATVSSKDLVDHDSRTTPARADRAPNSTPNVAMNRPLVQSTILFEPTLSSFAVSSKPAATHPATQPAAPVIIRWTGKLLMVPVSTGRPQLVGGDAVIDLTGNPCEIRRNMPAPQQGDDIRAARVIYHSSDGSVKLSNSDKSPEVVISKLLNGQIDPQTTISTQTLDYSTDATGRKVAILTGPGHASTPIDASAEKQGKANKPPNNRMDARWTQGAKLYFAAGRVQDNQRVEQIDLLGDVDVKHPQMVMQSQALSMFFEPPAKSDVSASSSSALASGKPTSQPELARVLATDSVHCELAGQNGKKQKVDCNRLEMRTAHTADGKFYARTVDARGAVHAFDSDQDLRSSALVLTLKPAAPKRTIRDNGPVARASTPKTSASGAPDSAAVELEKMVASQDVQVVNKEGSKATGSELTVTSDDAGNHIRLAGSPLATVIDSRKNVISGPIITFDPKDGVARIIGPGNMHVLQEQPDGGKPRPMDIAWTDRADMNGAANRIDVLGDVIVKTSDTEGAVNTATGDRVTIDLIRKAATALRPSATRSATQPASNGPAAAMQMDVMKDKDVRTVTLAGNAKVKSVLSGANGAITRQFVIVAPTVIYQMADTELLPAHTLWVPSAGQMFLGDHRAADKSKPSDSPKSEDVVGGRGNTAFSWQQMLLYKEVEHKAVMTGDVVIVHQPDGKESAEGPVKINADSVTAWFDSKKPAQASTAPSRPNNQPDSSMQLNHLTAEGHITVMRGQATLSADQIEYDPSTHWMTAHGTDNNPARYDTGDTGTARSFRDMAWNTSTWNFRAAQPRIVNPR